MLRIVVVTSVLHGVVGFTQVPRSTEQESRETRMSRTSPTVPDRCTDKVTKTCLAKRVDAMEAQISTLMAEVRELRARDAKGTFTSRDQLKAAIDEWVEDKTAAEKAHGPITDWDTSGVKDMSELFSGMSTFNEAIGDWDTSQVTTLFDTFGFATAFNQPLDWDTSQVTTLQWTFYDAEAFNQPLAWDTSKVTNMQETFYDAEAFNQPLLDWDTSALTSFDMISMFSGTGCAGNQCGCSGCQELYKQHPIFQFGF